MLKSLIALALANIYSYTGKGIFSPSICTKTNEWRKIRNYLKCEVFTEMKGFIEKLRYLHNLILHKAHKNLFPVKKLHNSVSLSVQ